MSQELEITWDVGELGTFSGTPQTFIDALPTLLTVTAENVDDVWTVGTVAPSSNQGPWMRNDRWFSWQDGAYKPAPDNPLIRRIMVQPDEPSDSNVAAEEPSDFETPQDGDGWVVTLADTEGVENDAEVLRFYSDGQWVDLSETSADRDLFTQVYASVEETVQSEVAAKIEGYQTTLSGLLATASANRVIVGPAGPAGPAGPVGPSGTAGSVDDSAFSAWYEDYGEAYEEYLYVLGLSNQLQVPPPNAEDILEEAAVYREISDGYTQLALSQTAFSLRLSNLESRIASLLGSSSDFGGVASQIIQSAYPVGVIVKFLGLAGTEEFSVAGMTFTALSGVFLCARNDISTLGTTAYTAHTIGGAGGLSGGSTTVTLTADQTGRPPHEFTFNHGSREPYGGVVRTASAEAAIGAWDPDDRIESSQAGPLDALEPHDNMPPYYAVKIYQRTA